MFLDERKKLSAGVGITYWYYRDSRFTPELESNRTAIACSIACCSPCTCMPNTPTRASRSSTVSMVRTTASGCRSCWSAVATSRWAVWSSVFIQVLWDVLQDPNSPYGGQPFFSMGVGVGF